MAESSLQHLVHQLRTAFIPIFTLICDARDGIPFGAAELEGAEQASQRVRQILRELDRFSQGDSSEKSLSFSNKE